MVKDAVPFPAMMAVLPVKPSPAAMSKFSLLGKETSTVPVPVLVMVTVRASGTLPAMKLPKATSGEETDRP